jgi:hypothetical protein
MNPFKFYRFGYYTPGQDERRLLHQLRDGDASLELSEVLRDKGYRYGGLILNYPVEDRTYFPKDSIPRRIVDDSFLKPGDLILLTTRPPLDDRFDPAKSYFNRSYTTLEDKVFVALRKYFQHCSRIQVFLSDYVVGKYPQVRERCNIQFRQNQTQNLKQNLKNNLKQNLGAAYDSINRHKPPSSNRTALYMVFIESAWENGPRLLCAFGMGGPETLIWTHLLRTRFPDLVASQEFIMAEVEEQPIRPGCDSLSEVDKWEVEILT